MMTDAAFNQAIEELHKAGLPRPNLKDVFYEEYDEDGGNYYTGKRGCEFRMLSCSIAACINFAGLWAWLESKGCIHNRERTESPHCWYSSEGCIGIDHDIRASMLTAALRVLEGEAHQKEARANAEAREINMQVLRDNGMEDRT